MARGVVCLEVRVVVCACRNLAVVWHICRNGESVSGVLEDGVRGVAGIGASEGDLEADFEEVLFEHDDMDVVWYALESVIWRLGIECSWDLGWLHRPENCSVGASDTNGVRTLVGFGLGRSKTRKQITLAPRSVRALDVNGVGTPVVFFPEAALVKRCCKRHRDLSRSELRTQTALGCRRQRGSIGVGMWVDQNQYFGQAGEPWSSTASGRQSGFVWQ